MNLTNAGAVRVAGVLGAGTIGAGWSVYFLSRGLEVVLYDPEASREASFQANLAQAWPVMERLGLSGSANPDRWRFVRDARSAVADADFVQENVPEQLEMKQQLYREIDPVLPAAAVVASSTSALCMSDLQQGLVNRGRYVVGHPFNPVHLIPAVEVVGGRETDSATVEWASTFYRKLGKQVIRLHKEMPGHLIDRLQGAIFREALHVVMEGIADVEAVDRGIAYGPGLRWSLMGIFLTWHLAAGPGGMRDYLTRYSDTFERMWKDLGSPHITPDVVERIVAGVAAEARGRTVQELIEERDALLVPLLTTLSAKGTKLSGESSASWWTR